MAPFNAGEYGHATIILNNPTRQSAEVFRYPDVRQYRQEVEAFVKAATGRAADIFTLENSKGNQAAIDAIYAAAEQS